MKRCFIAALLAVMLAFSACGEAQDITVPEAPSKTYTHEERMEILDNTKLPMSGSFYDPELREQYFEQLKVINEEYHTPGVVADAEFTEFLRIRSELLGGSSAYPTLQIEAGRVSRNNYTDATVTIIDGDEVRTEEITIKIRGNSTAEAPKKPYNIKFNESISLVGLEEGKKWSLLANMYDKTFLRNRLALDFARAIGIKYTSECEYVEVWMNGTYLGNYLLCEPISDGKNRVPIQTDAFDFILEVAPGGDRSFTTDAGVPILYDNPETPTAEQEEYLKEFLDDMEAALETEDMSMYSEYIDVGSFIDLYLTMELFKDVDAYNKSLFVFVEDGKLYAGPPWDFDLTCGNVSTTFEGENYYLYHNVKGYGDNSGDSTHGFMLDEAWFGTLLDDPDFSQMLRERYEELQPLITSLYDGEDNMIDTLVNLNAVSFAREYRDGDLGDHGAGWDVYKNYSPYSGDSKGDYSANVEYLREWLRDRNAWLLENIGR